MRTPEDLSNAHALLLAVQAASDGDLGLLLKIVGWRHDVLSNTLTYRLLLSFYPMETTEPRAIRDFLQILKGSSNEANASEIPSLDPSISSLSRNEAIRRCRDLFLRPIPTHSSIDTQSEFTNFVVEWAKRLEQLDGTVQPSAEFVQQFVEQDPDLQLWYETYLVPTLRLQYEFYPDEVDIITLEDMEKVTGSTAIKTLMQHAQRQQDPSVLVRDLDQVVSPWVYGEQRAKRRKLDQSSDSPAVEDAQWGPVYDWFLSSSHNGFDATAKAYVEWSGPTTSLQSDVEPTRSYAQTGLAMIYACSDSSTNAQVLSGRVLSKSAELAGVKPPDLSLLDPDISLPANLARDLDASDLLPTALRKRSNRFTHVNASSIQLLAGLLTTAKVLSGFGLQWTINDLAQTCVFGSERRHKDELRRLLQHIPLQTRREIDWPAVRQRVIWLQSWTSNRGPRAASDGTAFFSRLSLDYVETQLLDTLMKATQYSLVKDIYLSDDSAPLPLVEVESRVTAAIFDAYDNASNGNRDRGGMKRASDILKAFRPNFPQSQTLSDIDYLIKATHSLSFYQLTLQHGVPFKPVAIRVQKDPLTLLEKVLEQDARAYTKLDDLLAIGRNLVYAHASKQRSTTEDSEPVELRILHAEHRIIYLAIMAALAANDFDTAYAYITTRLNTSPEQSANLGFTDDTSWRAADAAGRYRPSGSPKSLSARIDSLAQRMELLSRALMLAPSGEALSGILATWRRYEEELDGLRTQAVEEERAFDTKADTSLPGAFGLEDREADAAETKRAMARRTWPNRSGPSYEQEAPLGLFDVARGAASALRHSAAFPLGSTGLRDLKINPGTSEAQDHQRDQALSPTSDDGKRVRKRDMVANMVGSGLGWVLGAQPTDRVDYRDEN